MVRDPLAPGAGLTLAFALLLGCASPDGVVRLDPEIDRLLPPGAAAERLADGFAWVEGPAWDRAVGALLFTDIPANSVYRWSRETGVELFLRPSGYSGSRPFTGREPGANGLTFDPRWRLVLCEHGDRGISRLEIDGTRTTLVDRFEGKRLNSPNDAVYSSSGDLYFTDPPFGLPGTFDDPDKELDFSGVYRLSAAGELTLLERGLRAPNGIALSPDERTLYVTDVDPERPAWLAYDVLADGALGGRRLFFDASGFARELPGGPDGLVVGRDGHLFAAGPGGVYVFAPDGRHLGTVPTGVATSNCAWGEDGSVLYVTASDAVLRIETSTSGRLG